MDSTEDRIPVRWMRERFGLIPEADLAATFDINENTLATWRSKNYGPQPIKVGRQVFYLADEVKRWLNEPDRYIAPESDPA